jgi:hypothetical protein
MALDFFLQYAYKTIIVSALFLYNFWLEFNETLWEPIIQRGDALIVALLRSDPSHKVMALD